MWTERNIIPLFIKKYEKGHPDESDPRTKK